MHLKGQQLQMVTISLDQSLGDIALLLVLEWIEIMLAKVIDMPVNLLQRR